ncbi:MAG TPA: tRNA 2-thiocytidine(32) synthetase TtcA, partial [Clostridia bacterium]|nr:tRNA 2-thiocytidine(32) synthetase TtcA [Clostridia bacterium]
KFMSPVKYELEAITLDMGFPDVSWAKVEQFCNDLSVPYTVNYSQIGEIVFDIRDEKTPVPYVLI